jgi:hypothetical protein
MTRGIKTSEFWVTVVASLLSIGVAAGLVGQQEATEINNASVALINAIFEMVKVLAPVLGAAVYTVSRAKVKAGQ